MKAMFGAMLKHMAWADARIGAALADCANDGDPEAAARLAECVRLYAHIVAAETIWLARLTGNAVMPASPFPEWNLAEARARSEEVLPKYERFLVEETDFRRIVEYKTSAGTPYATAAADILTHVFLHGSYHRGQINARLRGAGFEPTNVDYITFVR